MFAKRAFTLAEVMIVISIIAIISVFWIKIVKSQLSYANKMAYYATTVNLKKGTDYLINQGTKKFDGSFERVLPDYAHKLNDNGGFCDRLADTYNTHGSVDCTATATATSNFATATPNFTISNGATFYNVGGALLNESAPASKTASCPSGQIPADISIQNGPTYCLQVMTGASACPVGMTVADLTIASKAADEIPAATYYGAPGSCTPAMPGDYVPPVGSHFYGSKSYSPKGTSEGCQLGNDTNLPEPPQLKPFICYSMPGKKADNQAVADADDTDTGSLGYYDIFVDIDGPSRGKSILNQDVFEFYISRGGSIYPALSSTAANDKDLIKASIYYVTNLNKTLLSSNLTYRQALCVSNTVEAQLLATGIDYCNGNTADTAHCPTTNNQCKVVLTKPGY